MRKQRETLGWLEVREPWPGLIALGHPALPIRVTLKKRGRSPALTEAWRVAVEVGAHNAYSQAALVILVKKDLFDEKLEQRRECMLRLGCEEFAQGRRSVGGQIGQERIGILPLRSVRSRHAAGPFGLG